MKMKFLTGGLLACFMLMSSCGESIVDNRNASFSDSGDGRGDTQSPDNEPNQQLDESKLNWNGSSFKGTDKLAIYSID